MASPPPFPVNREHDLDEENLQSLVALVQVASRVGRNQHWVNDMKLSQTECGESLAIAREELNYKRTFTHDGPASTEATRELEEEVQVLEDSLRNHRETLADLNAKLEDAQEEFLGRLDGLSIMEEEDLRSSLERASIYLSPLFWRGFRRNRRRVKMLMDRKMALELVRSRFPVELGALDAMIPNLKDCISGLDTTAQDSILSLRRSLLRFDAWMDPCRVWFDRLTSLSNDVSALKTDQIATGMCLTLGHLAPVLGQHGMVSRPRVQISIIDEEKHGQPFLYLDPAPKRDDDTKNAVQQELAKVKVQIRRSKEHFRDANSNYTKDLYPCLIAHPRRTAKDFRRKHMVYKRHVFRALQQKLRRERELLREGKRYGMWADLDDHDFRHHDSDSKHKHPCTAEQLKQKAMKVFMVGRMRLLSPERKVKATWKEMEELVDDRKADIQEWINSLSVGPDPQTVDMPQPTSEPCYSPIPLSDLDRGLDNSLAEDALELRTRLLEKYREDQEAMREELEVGRMMNDSAF